LFVVDGGGLWLSGISVRRLGLWLGLGLELLRVTVTVRFRVRMPVKYIPSVRRTKYNTQHFSTVWVRVSDSIRRRKVATGSPPLNWKCHEAGTPKLHAHSLLLHRE